MPMKHIVDLACYMGKPQGGPLRAQKGLVHADWYYGLPVDNPGWVPRRRDLGLVVGRLPKRWQECEPTYVS